MPKTPPKKMDSWQVFTEKLFRSEDADPGYIAIARSGLHENQLKRACVAWCTFYNLGIAGKASELKGKAFWDYLLKLYPTAKRATERRHFRGKAGLKAMASWRENWPEPEKMMDHILAAKPTYVSIRERVRPIAQMGDYFVWKMSDLYWVLTKKRVEFVRADLKHMPKTPQQGAELIRKKDEILSDTVTRIVQEGRSKKLTAPPWNTEDFGIAEAETVCCVYKQMAGGGYTYGLRTAKALKRIRSIECKANEALEHGLLSLSQWTPEQLDAIYDAAH